MADLGWIGRAPGGPYFVTNAGAPWTLVGQNDAVSWPEWRGLLHRRDLAAVERHLARLRGDGVTCLRFMLEYAETGEHFFEQPAGAFNWVRWDLHAYNAANGGPCPARTSLLVHPGVHFLPLVDWRHFDRHPIEVGVSDPAVACFACGDRRQAVVWLLRTTPLLRDGRVDLDARSAVSVRVPRLAAGLYWATTWDTRVGRQTGRAPAGADAQGLGVSLPAMPPDFAISICPA